MDRPIVVVVTPAFNANEFLNETIFSVINQRGNFILRYHVQDGGSSDNTVNILRQWEERLKHEDHRIEFSWRSAPDTGMYDALNRGFSHVLSQFESGKITDPILTWINADDILLPNSIQTASDYFVKNPQSKWITGVSTLMSESGILSDTSANPTGFAQAALVSGQHDGRFLPFVQQEGTFFRSSLWNLAGGVLQTFRLAGDWDLWRRFAMHAELIKLRCVLAVHRRHPGQLSNNMFNYYKEVDCAAPLVTPLIDINENATFAIYDTDFRTWTHYLATSNELRSEMTPSKYASSIVGRIDLGLSRLPAWVESISGISCAESFGRWSDANLAQNVRIVAYAPLPRRFQLCLSMRVLSEVENSPVTICVGTSNYLINVTDKFTEVKLDIDNSSGANVIDITPKKSISPMELGWSSDKRRLALAIAWITIDDKSESEQAILCGN